MLGKKLTLHWDVTASEVLSDPCWLTLPLTLALKPNSILACWCREFIYVNSRESEFQEHSYKNLQDAFAKSSPPHDWEASINTESGF